MAMLNRQKILHILNEKKEELAKYGVSKVGLFGSYVKGTNQRKSDIDILIEFQPQKETFDNFMKIYDLLENAFKGHKVEVVTKNGLSKYFGQHILEETEYV